MNTRSAHPYCSSVFFFFFFCLSLYERVDIMYKGYGARNFAKKFYKSKSWELKSKNYRKQHPFCERCMAKGIYTPSQLVHHKVHIDPTNCHDSAILMGDDNLEALCKECHCAEHNKKDRVQFNPDGSLIM